MVTKLFDWYGVVVAGHLVGKLTYQSLIWISRYDRLNNA